MKKIAIVIISVLFGVQLFAQSEAIITDRPDRAESSCTVPHKTLQVESGFLMEFDETDIFDHSNIVYNSTLFRYGLLEDLELRFGVEYSHTKSTLKSNLMEFETKGFVPILLGAKINITEQKELLPEMALLTHVVLPNTGAEEFQSATLTPDIVLSMSYEFTPVVSSGLNIGLVWEDGSSKANGLFAWVVGLGITDKFGVYAELYGDVVDNGIIEKDIKVVPCIDGGITYLFSPIVQLDIAGGFGLTENANDSFVGLGISFRIPK